MSDWFKRILRKSKNEDGLAAIEATLIFPILLILLLGTFDMGFGILASQKTIRASQVTADLIARSKSVTSSDIDEAINGGLVSLVPFDTTSFGVDIVSTEFDDDGNSIILWRRTQNMSPNNEALSSLEGLGVEGEGLVIVTVQYTFEPVFAGFVVDDFMIEEVSFVRGRLSSTVPMRGG